MGQKCSTLASKCCCCGCADGGGPSSSSSDADGAKSTARNENFVLNPLATAVSTSSSAAGDADETAASSSNTDILAIRSFDLCFADNGRTHHTERFAHMQPTQSAATISSPAAQRRQRLVVRRGQPFRVRLLLNRPFEAGRDTVSFVFTLAGDEKASLGHRTLIGTTMRVGTAAANGAAAAGEWDSVAESWSSADASVTVLIRPAATAPIGEWRMDADTQRDSADGMRSFRYPSTFYLLFNPWCADDQVCLTDDEQLDEYVLNDTTLIWRGSYNRLRPSVWKLGQFEEQVLDCALVLLAEVGRVPAAFRGDPVTVARALSAAVNSPDDNGCVMGNWSEDFSGGTAPTRWLGSAAILQEYYRKRRSVRFGQCWVFAGVLSTIARALGLPSRIITNYSSAHDTQASLTVDYFVDRDGRLMDEMVSDSIWNYHVWNEVWMERPDLGMAHGGYGGWQAIDATPQEMSDQVYRCGPAPVRAVKLGEVQRPYDCNFLYAEVNADKVFWRYDGPAQPLKLLRKDTVGIGQAISTKAVGRWEREDVTSTYKFAEKSVDERDTMHRALKQTNSAYSRYYLNEDFNEVFFDFELLDDIKIGETFRVSLLIRNKSSLTKHRVSGSLRVESVTYTGKQRDDVKSQHFELELQPNGSETIEMEVTFDEYYKRLLDQAAFNISCLASVRDTDYEYFAQDDFRVRKPDIKITLATQPPVARQPTECTVRLHNPLPVALRKGQFHIEGTGLAAPIVLKAPDIGAGQTGEVRFTYTAPWAGRASLAAKFFSKQLTDVDGFVGFEVRAHPDDVIVSNEVTDRSYGYGTRRRVVAEESGGGGVTTNPVAYPEPRPPVNEFRLNVNAGDRFVSRTEIPL